MRGSIDFEIKKIDESDPIHFLYFLMDGFPCGWIMEKRIISSPLAMIDTQ